MVNKFLNRIIANDYLPLRYQHEVQGTKEPNSIFLFIEKYRYVHFWDNNIQYILHHFKACQSTIEMNIFIYIVTTIIWERIRIRKNIFYILEIFSCTYKQCFVENLSISQKYTKFI